MTFFYTAESRAELVREAQRWIGTQFLAHGRTCQGGVDCVGLPMMIYRAVGFLGEFPVPEYSMDGGHHRKDSPLEQVIEMLGRFKKLDANATPRLWAGDLLTMQLGRMPYHCGLAIGPTAFIHAHPTAGVIRSDLRDPTYLRRLRAIYTPLAIN